MTRNRRTKSIGVVGGWPRLRRTQKHDPHSLLARIARMGKAAPDPTAGWIPDGVVPADADPDAHVISVHGILIDLYERDREVISIELTTE